MRPRSALHDYQLEAIEWMADKEEGMIWLGLGDGKTIIALTSILDSGQTALVVSTKRIIEDTWPREIAAWEHTAGLEYRACVGPKRQREKALSSPCQILGVSFENLKWFYETGSTLPEILIFDEISKMKAPGTKRLRAHLKHAMSYSRRFGLTATPAAESYVGLWGQVTSIAPTARPLGKNITEFRNRFTTQHYKGMYTEYVIDERNRRDIERVIAPMTFVIDDSRRPPLAEPTYIDHHIPWGHTGPEQQYKEMEKRLVVELEGSTVYAANMGVAFNKCRQLATGFIYDADRSPHAIDEGKLDAIQEEYEALGGEPVLVFYQYEWERDSLLARLEGPEILEGDNFKRWNANEIPALILHPASCGHGLNLQGVCRHVFWGSFPWSLEHYLQANGRVHRQGQTKQVVIKHFMRSGTIEEDVLARLQGKIEGQDELLERMKARQ